MAATPPSSIGALVLDANVVIAISSSETGRDAVATAEITDYVNLGFELYAPGVLIAGRFFDKAAVGSTALLPFARSTIKENAFSRPNEAGDHHRSAH